MERKNNKTKQKKSKQIVRNRESAPVAYSEKQTFPNRQRMTSRRIQNSEFVATIAGSTTFSSAQKFVINPGLVGTFPWLSVMAAEWQQYRIHKMCFRFVTRTATSSTGSVILSPDYNAVDTAPSTEAIASNTQDAVEDVCWKSLTCHLDVAAMFPFGPRKQIRIGAISGDYTTYDAGRLFVCVIGQSSAADIGKLWVDYDVELFVPQSSPAQTVPGTNLASVFSLSANQAVTSGSLTTIPFDATDYNPLSIVNSSGTFTPPAGNYLAQCFIGTSTTSSGANTLIVDVYKNGASFKNAIIDLYQNTGTGAARIGASTCIYLLANGSDTFAFRFTYTASLTLTLLAAPTRVSWIAI